MTYKVLVLDLDGTLLTSNNVISDNTREALLTIQEQGVIIILASGRPTFGMLPTAKALKLKEYGGYLLSYNGGQVIRMVDDALIFETTLNVSMIHKLANESINHKTGFVVYRYDYLITPQLNPYIQSESDATGLRVLEVKDIKTATDQTSVKCLMTGEPSYLESVRLKLTEKYDQSLSIYRSMPYFLELMPKGIDKGSRLRELALLLNMPLDEIIACGDSFNDLSLIEVSGLGVAMGNACQELKDKADYTTSSHNDDGIVKVINQFILK